jgi:hypothetical protein
VDARREVHVKLAAEIGDDIRAVLEAEPTMTMDEMAIYIKDAWGIIVDRSTIRKHLYSPSGEGWSRKSLTFSSTSVNPLEVAALHRLITTPHLYIVWQDEMGILLGITY